MSKLLKRLLITTSLTIGISSTFYIQAFADYGLEGAHHPDYRCDFKRASDLPQSVKTRLNGFIFDNVNEYEYDWGSCWLGSNAKTGGGGYNLGADRPAVESVVPGWTNPRYTHDQGELKNSSHHGWVGAGTSWFSKADYDRKVYNTPDVRDGGWNLECGIGERLCLGMSDFQLYNSSEFMRISGGDRWLIENKRNPWRRLAMCWYARKMPSVTVSYSELLSPIAPDFWVRDNAERKFSDGNTFWTNVSSATMKVHAVDKYPFDDADAWADGAIRETNLHVRGNNTKDTGRVLDFVSTFNIEDLKIKSNTYLMGTNNITHNTNGAFCGASGKGFNGIEQNTKKFKHIINDSKKQIEMVTRTAFVIKNGDVLSFGCNAKDRYRYRFSGGGDTSAPVNTWEQNFWCEEPDGKLAHYALLKVDTEGPKTHDLKVAKQSGANVKIHCKLVDDGCGAFDPSKHTDINNGKFEKNSSQYDYRPWLRVGPESMPLSECPWIPIDSYDPATGEVNYDIDLTNFQYIDKTGKLTTGSPFMDPSTNTLIKGKYIARQYTYDNLRNRGGFQDNMPNSPRSIENTTEFIIDSEQKKVNGIEYHLNSTKPIVGGKEVLRVHGDAKVTGSDNYDFSMRFSSKDDPRHTSEQEVGKGHNSFRTEYDISDIFNHGLHNDPRITASAYHLQYNAKTGIITWDMIKDPIKHYTFKIYGKKNGGPEKELVSKTFEFASGFKNYKIVIMETNTMTVPMGGEQANTDFNVSSLADGDYLARISMIDKNGNPSNEMELRFSKHNNNPAYLPDAGLNVTAVKDVAWEKYSYPIPYSSSTFPLGENTLCNGKGIKCGYTINYNFNIRTRDSSNYNLYHRETYYTYEDSNGSPLNIENVSTAFAPFATNPESNGTRYYASHYLPVPEKLRCTYSNGSVYRGKIYVNLHVNTDYQGWVTHCSSDGKGHSSCWRVEDYHHYKDKYRIYVVDNTTSALDDVRVNRQR